MPETLELVGRSVAMSSPGHGSRSADHHGTVIEVVSRDDEVVFLVVRWLDGRLSVIPASECIVAIDDGADAGSG